MNTNNAEKVVFSDKISAEQQKLLIINVSLY